MNADEYGCEQKLPAGWDEEKVRSVLAFYDTQTETVMSVPHELVPAVRELIAKRQR